MKSPTIGVLVHDFLLVYLASQKGLRQSSIRSYRDTLRLFLPYVASRIKKRISRLQTQDLSCDRVLDFLQHMEQKRHNSVSTRNQRLAAIRMFYDYIGRQCPEALPICQQVGAIPTKRTSSPNTRYIPRDEVQALFDRLPTKGRHALRDRVLLLFLYNTGARVQEVADLRIGHLTLEQPSSVRLHGKGDKWRQCPLWQDTAEHLARLIEPQGSKPEDAVFISATGQALTRFGIYKRVRHLTIGVRTVGAGDDVGSVSPHTWRHTTAVHLLEAGVDVNVIRGWLGHVSLNTTNRYAEITMHMKTEAMRLCAPTTTRNAAPWKSDPSLLNWLNSL
jgi:integrase/recombinase XerD